ncbi:hypothetical protein HWV62_43608 [Athelia sp. TMB]|nr:hypothetical protein HWV62_43608 [Athelia sp. TMB]
MPMPSVSPKIEPNAHSDAASESDASSDTESDSHDTPEAVASSGRKDMALAYTKKGLKALEIALKFAPISGLDSIATSLLMFVEVYETVEENSEKLEKLRSSIQSFSDNVLVPIGSFGADVRPETQDQINKLKKTLEQHRVGSTSMQEGGFLRRALLSPKIKTNIDSAKNAVESAIETFTRLAVAKADYLHASKDACTLDTRVDMRATIMRHLDQSSNRFVWLRGSPGTGKTAISKSIAIELRKQGRLAASFYFEKTGSNRFAHSTDRFSSTLAHQLANFHPLYRHTLFCHLRARHGDYPPSPLAQLLELVIARLDEHPDMPFPSSVIVLDGLDECGGSDQTALEDLMDLILELSRLPSSVKFFISSRPEGAISRAWSRHPQTKYIVTEDVDHIRAEENREDIAKFVRERLRARDRGSPNWPPSDKDIGIFADQCQGIFEIARIRVRFLEQETPAGARMDEVFNMLIQTRSGPAGVSQFAQEYLWILRRAFPSPDEIGLNTLQKDIRKRARARFRTVIGAILAMRWPLRVKELSLLLQMEESDVTSALTALSSIIQIQAIYTGRAEISFFHATCSEFLCGKFNEPGSAVDPVFLFEDTVGSILAAPCLDLLVKQLQPGKMLDTVSDGYDVVMCYASHSWAYHLDLAPHSPLSSTLLAALRPFLSQYLLAWLEFGWIMSPLMEKMFSHVGGESPPSFEITVSAIQGHLRSLLTEMRAEDLALDDRWMYGVLLESFGSWQGYEGLLSDSSRQQSNAFLLMQSRLYDLVERVRQVQPHFKPHSLFGRASLKYPFQPALASEPVVSNVDWSAADESYVRCSTLSPQGRLALSFLNGSLQVSDLYFTKPLGWHLVPAPRWSAASLPPYVWFEFIMDGRRLVGEDVDGMVWVLDESGVVNTFGPLPAPGPRTNAVASQDGMYLVRAPSQHRSYQSFSWYNQMVLLQIVGNEISWRTLASPTDVGEFPLLGCIPMSLGFSPDGKHVGAFDERVAHIWSVHSAHHVESWDNSSASDLIVNPITPIHDVAFEAQHSSTCTAASEAPTLVTKTLVYDITEIKDSSLLPRDMDSYVFVRSIADKDRAWSTFSHICPDGTMFMHWKTGVIYNNGWQTPPLYAHGINPNERMRIMIYCVAENPERMRTIKYACNLLIGGWPKINGDDEDADILFPPVFASVPRWTLPGIYYTRPFIGVKSPLEVVPNRLVQ